jgi:prolycopene isomerase
MVDIIPGGGMQGFADAFVDRFKIYGGQLILGKKVEQILLQDRQIKGVVLEGGKAITAKTLISNADATQVFKKLLKNHTCKEYMRVNKFQVSPSLFTMYIGAELDWAQFASETCNIWSADTYRFGRFISDLDRCIELPSPPFMMISFPSAHADNLKNKNKNTIQFFVIAPFKSEDFWNNYRLEFEEKLIRRSEAILPFLRNHIRVKLTATPVTFHRYTLNRDGAAFGWASTLAQIRSTLFPAKTSIERLFFTGHWCTIGSGQGGVPKAIFSGRKTAQLVLKNIGKR